MSVLWIVLPIALVMAGAAVAAFLWVVRSGQYDDLDSPPWRVVLDEDDSPSRRPDQPLPRTGATPRTPEPRRRNER